MFAVSLRERRVLADLADRRKTMVELAAEAFQDGGPRAVSSLADLLKLLLRCGLVRQSGGGFGLTATGGAVLAVTPAPGPRTLPRDVELGCSYSAFGEEWCDDLAGRTIDSSHVVRRIEVCRRCPFALACLERAMYQEGTLQSGSRFYVSGGLTPYDRYAWKCELKRARQVSA